MTQSIYKTALVFLFTLITLQSTAQLLDTNTIWSERGDKYSYITDDSVTMNSKLYHRINRHSDTTISYSNDIDETFLIRMAGDSVFRYDSFRDEDVLIYDFSLEIDDSIFVHPKSNIVNDSVLLRCENVDTVTLLGIQRRRLTMRTLDPEPYYQNDIEYWYWGIGSNLGLLKAGHQGVSMALDSYAPLLYCCHKVFDQVYQTSLYDKCYNTASVEHHTFIENIEIYPNPISSGQPFIFEIQNDQVDKMIIYNLQGKQIHQALLEAQSKSHIDESFDPGVYMVLFYSDNEVIHRKKLVVHE